MKKISILLIIAMFTACNVSNEESKVKVRKGNNIYVPEGKILNESQIKQVVIDELIQEDLLFEEGPVLSNPSNRYLTNAQLGPIVLVKDLSARNFNEQYYYSVMGSMPDGRIIAAQSYEAKNGEFIDGIPLYEGRDRNYYLMNKEEAKEYFAKKLSISDKSKIKVEAVFKMDVEDGVYDRCFAWTYLVQVTNDEGEVIPLSTKSGLKTDFFVDPVIVADKKEKATGENAYNKYRIFVNKYEVIGTKSQNDKTAGWFSYEGID